MSAKVGLLARVRPRLARLPQCPNRRLSRDSARPELGLSCWFAGQRVTMPTLEIDKRPCDPLACNVSVYERPVCRAKLDARTVNSPKRAAGHPYGEHILGPAGAQRHAGSKRAGTKSDRAVRVGGPCRSTSLYLGRSSQPPDGRSGGLIARADPRPCASRSLAIGVPPSRGEAAPPRLWNESADIRGEDSERMIGPELVERSG